MAAVTVASVILLFFLPLGVIRNAVGQPVGQPYYEYLQFVLQYPRTVNPRSKIIYQRFTIHGLWPSNYSKEENLRVRNCNPNYTREQLSKELSADLRANLKYSWPNVERPDNLWFWTDQYKKHGSCANHTFTTRAYFGKAYDLYNRTPNLSDLFVSGGLLPGESYKYRKFMDLVQNATGGTRPRLWCNKTNKTLLQEVVICYNKNATKVINCSLDTGGRNCWGKILYPKEIALGQISVEAGAARRGPSYMVSMVLFFSLPLGLIIFKYGPSYIKSKLA